jgi:hypothetical protein
MRIVILICLFPIFVFAQDYYEASGRTEVFTLKAGAKALPVATKAPRLSRNQTAFRCTISGNTLSVSPARAGTLKLYMLDGRSLEVHSVNPAGKVNLKRHLENGVYLLKFVSDGSPAETAKLVITGNRSFR